MRVLLFILFPIPSLEPFNSVLLFSLSCFTLSLSLLSYTRYSMSVSIFQIITTRRQYIFTSIYIIYMLSIAQWKQAKHIKLSSSLFFKRFALQIITCMPLREYKCSICLHICPSNIFIISYYIFSWRQLFFLLLYPFEGIFYHKDVKRHFYIHKFKIMKCSFNPICFSNVNLVGIFKDISLLISSLNTLV